MSEREIRRIAVRRRSPTTGTVNHAWVRRRCSALLTMPVPAAEVQPTALLTTPVPAAEVQPTALLTTPVPEAEVQPTALLTTPVLEREETGPAKTEWAKWSWFMSGVLCRNEDGTVLVVIGTYLQSSLGLCRAVGLRGESLPTCQPWEAGGPALAGVATDVNHYKQGSHGTAVCCESVWPSGKAWGR